jgi:hypothetical protein
VKPFNVFARVGSGVMAQPPNKSGWLGSEDENKKRELKPH